MKTAVNGFDLSDSEIEWLYRIAIGGTWPSRPFLHALASGPLMRKGLVEVVKPEQINGRAAALPYARLTSAGWEKVNQLRERHQ